MSPAGYAPRAAGLAFPRDAQRSHLLETPTAFDEDMVSSVDAPLGSGQLAGHYGDVQAQPLREALDGTTEAQAAVQGCLDTPSQPCNISL